MKILHFISRYILTLLLWTGIVHAACFTFNFTAFNRPDEEKLYLLGDSQVTKGALQVTIDVNGDITNQAGRILYKKPFKLYKKQKLASFTSTFVLNIENRTEVSGEGLAFVLSKDQNIPPINSYGQWLGVVNFSSNGSSENGIVAIEFDTQKSYFEDLDDNHVGLDFNSVYSDTQVSLNNSGIIMSDGTDITAVISYNGTNKLMEVSVFKGNQVSNDPNSTIISKTVDLSHYLPDKIYVGFSASTGNDSTELNCVRSWSFSGEDIDKNQTLWLWIAISALSVVLLVCVMGGVSLYWRLKVKEKQAKNADGFNLEDIETELGPKKFKLKDLKTATQNFDTKNELGRGGFGVVYKGIWGTKEIAVKKIIDTSKGKQNLIAEVTTIVGLHHKNLVELLGWCYESNELLLVYEYMPNGSLDRFIDSKVENLSWEKRHDIISGVAQAVDYLHHECSKTVLHRDIKTSNIMLDSNFNARLGDFGLARMFERDEKTHHTTKELTGTPAYMAPEIFHMGRTTAETDVFAFGVLVLVVASGRKPWNVAKEEEKHGESIVDWVWGLHESNTILNALDPNLGSEVDMGQAQCLLQLGLACCHPNPYMRPSMRVALQVLMREVNPPFVPLRRPVFMWPASMPSVTQIALSLDGGDSDTWGSSLGEN